MCLTIEIEVLEIKEDCMVYAIDRKDDTKNRCVIERYTFEDKKITSLLSLDYTRLYEAFQTYGQNPAFFYAVNVLDDYRVRLRRIDKNSWEIKEDILLNAEGEVLSLYILDENHLLVTDEAEANESSIFVTGECQMAADIWNCAISMILKPVKNIRSWIVVFTIFWKL